MKQGTDRFVPIEKDVKDLILMYRVDHGLSYREIERRLGVSRETARLHCLENLTEEKRKSLKKRKNLTLERLRTEVLQKRHLYHSITQLGTMTSYNTYE